VTVTTDDADAYAESRVDSACAAFLSSHPQRDEPYPEVSLITD